MGDLTPGIAHQPSMVGTGNEQRRHIPTSQRDRGQGQRPHFHDGNA